MSPYPIMHAKQWDQYCFSGRGDKKAEYDRLCTWNARWQMIEPDVRQISYATGY